MLIQKKRKEIIETELSDLVNDTVITSTGSAKLHLYLKSDDPDNYQIGKRPTIQRCGSRSNSWSYRGRERMECCYEPSTHPVTKHPYKWRKGQSIFERPIKKVSSLKSLGFHWTDTSAPITKSKMDMYDAQQQATQYKAYIERAISNAKVKLLQATKGQRNATINKEIYGLGRLVGGGYVASEYIKKELLPVTESLFTGYGDDYKDKKTLSDVFDSSISSRYEKSNENTQQTRSISE